MRAIHILAAVVARFTSSMSPARTLSRESLQIAGPGMADLQERIGLAAGGVNEMRRNTETNTPPQGAAVTKVAARYKEAMSRWDPIAKSYRCAHPICTRYTHAPDSDYCFPHDSFSGALKRLILRLGKWAKT